MMKHAFLIMAHNNLEILQTLVSMLDDERNDIFLHIDLKSNMLANHPMSSSKARLFVLEHRVDVRWGNLSQIRTEYALLEEALKHGSYEYYHILSGQDLPIKTQDEIHQFFHEHRGKAFVGINRGEEFEWDSRRKMLRCGFLTRYTRTRWGWFNGIIRRINKYLSLCLMPFVHRSKMDFAKGANWESITQKCAEYVVSQKAFVLSRFNFTFCPDEFFLQTLVWNHPEFRQALYSETDEYEGCMRLIDWKRGNPYVWTSADKEELLHSNRLFARKFDLKDREIIKWVKETFS